MAKSICLIGRYNRTENFRGPEKVARRVADGLAALGCHVYFYEYFFSGEEYGIRDKLFGRKPTQLGERFVLYRVGLIPFVVELVRRRFDIIHIITFERFAVLALLVKPFLRARFFYTVNGIVRHEHAMFDSLSSASLRLKDNICESLLFRYSETLFFLSEDSISLACRYYAIEREKCVIVSNGVDAVFYSVKRADHSTPSPSVVFVGDPSRREKGFDFFVRALEHCKQRPKVFIVCSPEKISTIPPVNETTIQVTETTDAQAFAVFLADKHIYVSASSYEPFSIAAVEAMASGLIPVVTRETGMSRYVTNGENGFVIPFGDIASLAQVLDNLISDDMVRQRIAANVRSSITFLEWKNVCEDYLKLYRIQ